MLIYMNKSLNFNLLTQIAINMKAFKPIIFIFVNYLNVTQ